MRALAIKLCVPTRWRLRTWVWEVQGRFEAEKGWSGWACSTRRLGVSVVVGVGELSGERLPFMMGPLSGVEYLPIDRFPDDVEASYADVYPGEVEYFVRWAREAGGEGARVVELACGFGRIAIPLAQRGFAVTGLDRSRAMLSGLADRCDRVGARVSPVEGELRDFRIAGERFDLAYCPLAVANVLVELDEIESHFRCVAAAVRSGGYTVYPVTAGGNPRGMAPHRVTWRTKALGRETATDYGFDRAAGREADVMAFWHRLDVVEGGARRTLGWEGGMRIYTNALVREICRRVPEWTHVGWQRVYEFGPFHEAPRDEDYGSVLVLRRR
jgi:SAM-dependent methyltransferase